MKIGDIWTDKYGDYLLVVDVQKFNVRSKTKPFSIYIGAILMTNFNNHKEVRSGEYIDDYIAEYIVEKIA
jgi:hypothetical protein